MAEEVFFRMREIDKIYPLEGENVHALKKVSLTVEEGDYLSVLGPSPPLPASISCGDGKWRIWTSRNWLN